VVLCFDSDTAGQNAALRALDDLLSSGLAIRVATVPAPDDPDSFIKAHGAEAFRGLLERALGFFDYLLNRLVTANDPANDRGRAAIVRGMAENLLKSTNAVLLDTYAQKTAQRLGVSVEAVRAEFRKVKSGAPPPRETHEPSSATTPADAPPPTPHEFWLMRLVLGHDALVPVAASHLDLDWLQHVGVREIIERRLAAEEAGGWTSVAAFLGQFQDPRRQQLITQAVSEARGLLEPERQLRDVLRRLRDNAFDREIALVNRQIGDSTLGDAERLSLLRRKQELVAAKAAPLQP
jgi:DNA primase